MILALDTSGATGDFAITDGDRFLPVTHTEFKTERSHNSAVFPVLTAALETWGAPGMITAIAVGTGPGSYTGCRIGIAAGQALGLALGIPVHGIPSICAIRDAPGHYAVCGDARRGNFFYAEVAGGVITVPPRLGDREALISALRDSGLPLYSLDASPLGLGETRTRPHAPTMAARVPSSGCPPAPAPIYLAAPFVTNPKHPAPSA